MSILTAIVLLAATPAAAPPANVDPKVAAQVPVIAGKLEQWRGAWGAAGGKLACKTIRTSGDEEIDALGCASMIACVKPAYPALKTIADGLAATDEKKRLIAAKLATLQPCMKQHRGQGIAELALKRGRA